MRCTYKLQTSTFRQVLAPSLLLLLASHCAATELLVRISGVGEPLGEIGCSLFATADGFPMDNSKTQQLWQAADVKGVTCRFANLAEGTYAVSIGHDLNGNKRVDTNFIGLPTEQWGVSNNARPRLRAPRFEEASFKVSSDAREIVLDIKVDK